MSVVGCGAWGAEVGVDDVGCQARERRIKQRVCERERERERGRSCDPSSHSVTRPQTYLA